jgi:hypothetical protein
VTERHVVVSSVIRLGASGQWVGRVGEGVSERGGVASNPSSVRPITLNRARGKSTVGDQRQRSEGGNTWR